MMVLDNIFVSARVIENDLQRPPSLMLGANVFGVGARLNARRIDETLKDFIGDISFATFILNKSVIE